MNLNRALLEQFDFHLDQLERHHGIELDVQDRRQLLEASIANGFTPDVTEHLVAARAQAFTDDDEDFYEDDEDFEEEPVQQSQPRRDFHADLAHDLAGLQHGLGRKLTGKEIDGISQRAIDQVRRHDSFDVDAALEDFHRGAGTNPDKSQWKNRDWDDFMVQRARDMDPEPGPDPDREYDLSNRDDFVEYAALKMQGAEFEGAPARQEPEGETE